MTSSRKHNPKQPFSQLPKRLRELWPILLFDLYRRYQSHVKRYGKNGPHPASDEWIDLPAGTPARAYLEVYRRTNVLPDTRTATDPIAANEVWDWIENHEAAGTLPLCIRSIRQPVNKAELKEALMLLRETGVNPKEVIDLRLCRVRPSALDDDHDPGPFYDFTFSLRKDGVDGLPLEAGNHIPEECIQGIQQMFQELWGQEKCGATMS